jgi:GT2 family glycosyltransferase
MRISVIIPTRRAPFVLQRRIDEVAPLVSEVIVVYDGRSLSHIYERAVNLTSGGHYGFTRACNIGASTAKGDLILLLNDDCTLSPRTIRRLSATLQENPDIVATQPVIYDPRGNVENIGFTIDIRIGKALPVTNPSFFCTICQASPVGSVYGLSATCLLIKKEAFVSLGMFDESFHSYLEDVDLALRMHKCRMRVMPCLDAQEVHEHMQTSKGMGNYKQKQDVKNWLRIVWKHRDVFLTSGSLLPILVERGRNLSGLLKGYLRTGSQL